jgi:hypothetical protein
VEKCLLKVSVCAKYRHSEQDLQESEHLQYSHHLWLTYSISRSCSFYVMSRWPWFLLLGVYTLSCYHEMFFGFFNAWTISLAIFYLYKDIYYFWFCSTIFMPYFMKYWYLCVPMRVCIVVAYNLWIFHFMNVYILIHKVELYR